MFGKFVPDCVRRGSKFKVFLGGGACPQTPLVGTHAYACISMLTHATIILLCTILFSPPNSKSCMKPWPWFSVASLARSGTLIHPLNVPQTLF